MSPFRTLRRQTGIFNKSSTVRVEKSFHATIYVEKARVLRSNLTMFRSCQVWKCHEWFSKVLWLPRIETGLLCDLPKVLTDNVRYVVELVLPENFVPSIKALRECLV